MIMNPAVIHFYNSSISKFKNLDTKLTLNGVKIHLSNFGIYRKLVGILTNWINFGSVSV